MAASVLLTCNLNEHQLPPFTFIREDTGVDGSFLISSILGQRIKIQSTGTILVCLQNTFQHYSSAGVRLGYNLNMSRDKGTLIAIEPLLDLAENLFASNFLNACEEELLNTVWLKIEQAVDQLAETKQTLTLIIDNLSGLIDLGVGVNAIVTFCRKLRNYCGEKLSVVVKVNTSNLYGTVCGGLEDLADTEIRIEKLTSGNFKEVDGRIVCRRRQDNGFDKNEKLVLYKVNDRNIKIFAPGEVGVKA